MALATLLINRPVELLHLTTPQPVLLQKLGLPAALLVERFRQVTGGQLGTRALPGRQVLQHRLGRVGHQSMLEEILPGRLEHLTLFQAEHLATNQATVNAATILQGHHPGENPRRRLEEVGHTQVNALLQSVAAPATGVVERGQRITRAVHLSVHPHQPRG